MIRVGITGTRQGASDQQLLEVYQVLIAIPLPAELHHGDCQGVDHQVAIMAKELGFTIICHPPTSSALRAYFASDRSEPPLGYLQRDRKIVESTDLLIVVPLQTTWQPRGGTWYTHDYAVKKQQPVVVIYPV
jgi:hypothetical protein